MTTVYLNPRAQNRKTISAMFGVGAGHRSARTWNTNAVLVYDFYEVDQAADWDRAVAHCNQDSTSSIAINFSHESMPTNIQQANEYPTLLKLYRSLTNPQQLCLLLCQQDTIHSVAQHLPGVRTLYVNFWETHVAIRQPQLGKVKRQHRLGSFNRRYSAARALWIYHMRSHLENMLYTFGSGSSWTDQPDSVYQGEELKPLSHTNPELYQQLQQWQWQARPWRTLENVPNDDFDDPSVYALTASADTWAVIESRLEGKTRPSSFLTEKTFRPVAVGCAAFTLADGNTAETLRSMGYEPVWEPTRETWTEQIQELAEHCTLLLNMSNSKYQSYLHSIRERVQHNQQNFIQRAQPRLVEQFRP